MLDTPPDPSRYHWLPFAVFRWRRWGSSAGTSALHAGGGWGAAGGVGTAGPSAGGAGGKAIALNGFAVTWQGGNNTTQVLGAVS